MGYFINRWTSNDIQNPHPLPFNASHLMIFHWKRDKNRTGLNLCLIPVSKRQQAELDMSLLLA
jgi:hypothetical protein